MRSLYNAIIQFTAPKVTAPGVQSSFLIVNGQRWHVEITKDLTSDHAPYAINFGYNSAVGRYTSRFYNMSKSELKYEVKRFADNVTFANAWGRQWDFNRSRQTEGVA